MNKMSIEKAIELLHPDTTAGALAEIEYYGGFNGRTACLEAINDACKIACEIMDNYLAMQPLLEELKKRNLTLYHIREYIKFEDECIEKGFTFNSLIETMEKQIPKKPEKEAEDNLLCPACGGFLGYESECKEEPYQLPYCSGCGQAINWT